MKPTWPEVALFALAVALIGLVHWVSPTFNVMSFAASLLGVVVMWLTRSPLSPPAPPSSGDGTPPTLKSPPDPPALKRILALACLACGLGACAGAFTPADGSELLEHAGQLSRCQNVGREAGSYAAYDACKKEAGL